MHISAISRSLKISNSEGAVAMAMVSHFPLLENLHLTRQFPIILNELVSGVLGEVLYLGIPAVRSLNPRFSIIPQLWNDEKI